MLKKVVRHVRAMQRRSECRLFLVRTELDDDGDHYMGFFGRSFGQAWHWFKERKRAQSVSLNAHLTYVTLPWHRIIAGACSFGLVSPLSTAISLVDVFSRQFCEHWLFV